jgi:hypothetical protein
MSCFATVSPSKALLALLRIPHKRPLLHRVVRHFTKYVTLYDVNPHSTEQDTLPIVFLISKQVVPYQTRDDTCCPGVSTPMIRPLIDSSTTCHDSINHCHHSDHLLKTHHRSSHGHLTSQGMEDVEVLYPGYRGTPITAWAPGSRAQGLLVLGPLVPGRSTLQQISKPRSFAPSERRHHLV